MTKNLTIIFLFFLTLFSFGQIQIGKYVGKYVNAYKDYKSNLTLELNNDTSFKYQFNHSLGSCYAHGTWKSINDTIILFKKYSKYESDTAQSEYLNSVSSDSMHIKFLNYIHYKPLEIKIDGDCHKSYQLTNGQITLKKQHIVYLLVNGTQKIFIKNYTDNFISVQTEIWGSHTFPSFLEKERWLFMDGSLFMLDCSTLTKVKLIKP